MLINTKQVQECFIKHSKQKQRSRENIFIMKISNKLSSLKVSKQGSWGKFNKVGHFDVKTIFCG